MPHWRSAGYDSELQKAVGSGRAAFLAAWAGDVGAERTAASGPGDWVQHAASENSALLEHGALDQCAPAGRVPAGRAPAERVPAERVPAGRAPAGRAPAGRAPAGRAPAGRAPGG